jgi:uncharacterized Fe-S radical SAM superfamily protein PflX
MQFTRLKNDLVTATKDCPCMDCGRTLNSWQMHLDHRPGVVKLFSIRSYTFRDTRPNELSWKDVTIELLIEELEKCDPVCVNCHANRMRARRKPSRTSSTLKDDLVIASKDGPCIDCGYSFNYWQMQMDHRPGVKKLFSIGNYHTWQNHSPSAELTAKDITIELLTEELEKCDPVCGNCHANRTHERGNK